jgi:Rod binding domain-containing protein
MGAYNVLLSALPKSSLNRVNATTQRKMDELRKAAQDFEAVFIAQLLSQMRRSMAPPSSLLNGGNAEETFRSLMDQEIGKSVARRGRFGIADAIYRQLSKNAVNSADNSNSTPGAGLLKG